MNIASSLKEISLDKKALLLGSVKRCVFFSADDIAEKYPVGVYYFNSQNQEIFRYIFALGKTDRGYEGTETQAGKPWSTEELNTLCISSF